MTRGRKLGVCAEQNTLDINVPNLLKCTAANRAGAPRDNIYKDDQTSPQALATVADDERVGRIDHPSPDIVQRSHLGDIHHVSTPIVFLSRPIPHRQPLRVPTSTTGPTTKTRRTQDHSEQRGVIR